ncbi:MAG: M1 family metallopeptidase [Candidatus Aminicenantes bacterium]|nr:M1 family metallopeptidase [Candidatus Aminicenantes bacterium]
MRTDRAFVWAGLLALVSAGSGSLLAAPDGPLPVRPLRYEIWVELDNAQKMLRGREEITWQNTTRDEVGDIWLHLYWNAFKNEQSAFFREARGQTLARSALPREGEWGWIDISRIALADGRDLKPGMAFATPDGPETEGDQTVLRVPLPEPVPPGGRVALKIEFESKIPRRAARTAYYQDRYFIGQWFPKPGVYEEGKGWNCHAYHENSEFFADYADFLVHITVPQGFVVGASGKLVDAVRDEDRRTETLTYGQTAIHDFAWTADPSFLKVERDFVAADEVTEAEYADLARRLGCSVEDLRLPNVRMILLIAPEHKSQIDRHFRALKAALKYYGLWYGPYPYETITMVDPPFRTGSGGMEYPTLFTAGTSLFPTDRAWSPEGVIVHEFGHGYWYGLVGSNEFEEAWLDEGLNTYSTGKVIAEAYGPGVLSLNLKHLPLDVLFRMPLFLDRELNRAGGLAVVELDPIVTASWRFYSRMSYALNVYQRAATMLETLERLLGEDVMIRVLRAFQMGYRYRHPRSEDFVRTAEQVSGRDLGWFFGQFLYDTLEFDYGVSALHSRELPAADLGVFDRDGRKDEVTPERVKKIKQENKDSAKAYRTEVAVRRFGEAKVGPDFPLTLEVAFEDGSVETRTWDGQSRWQTFRFIKPVKARWARIDPESRWLLDSNLTNNSLRAKPSRAGVWRITGLFLFWVQSALHAAGGLV